MLSTNPRLHPSNQSNGRRTSRRMTRSVTAAMALCALIGPLSACGSAASAEPDFTPQSDSSAPARYQLASSCPADVVVQMSWKPEAEYGAIWNLLGDDYKIDATKKETTGTLTTSDGYKTGVALTIRNVPSSQTAETIGYINQDTFLTFLDTDRAISSYAAGPKYTAIIAPIANPAMMVMWDPKTYPNVKSIKDLKEKHATVLASSGTTWPSFLVSKGVLDSSQIDTSYTGDPARFVANPKVTQQGYSTSEPYQYLHEIKNWGKSVKYELISDYGYNVYSQPYAVRTPDLEKDAPCLTKLVPIIQRSMVDYAADGRKAITRIVKATAEYNDGWVYSKGLAEYSWRTMNKQNIVANENGMAGGIDMKRVQNVIDTFSPFLKSTGLEIPRNLKASDLYTTRFLDPSIKFPTATSEDGKAS